MAPMSAADRLLVREIVREVVQTPEMEALLAELATTSANVVVETHKATCPVAKRVNNAKWAIIGALMAGALLGLSSAPWIAKLLLSL